MENYQAVAAQLKKIKEEFAKTIHKDVPMRIFLGKLDWWLMGALEGDGASINRIKKCSEEFAGIILSISGNNEPEYVELKDELVCFAEKYLPVPTKE